MAAVLSSWISRRPGLVIVSKSQSVNRQGIWRGQRRLMVAGSQSGSTTELREDLGDLKWVRLGPHVKPKDLGDPEEMTLVLPAECPPHSMSVLGSTPPLLSLAPGAGTHICLLHPNWLSPQVAGTAPSVLLQGEGRGTDIPGSKHLFDVCMGGGIGV
jgi:hypothetical protein